MKLMQYFGRMLSETRNVNAEYALAYQRCFNGTEEETARRLEAWDWVHRITRQYSCL